ncbi:MAG TPA: LuxR C-terminal-related transcriptional regulator, partial [Arenibaculum sp.]|nr:LuxR C-terminal-related transcriptional regulator [Arenibaculum sp.]
LTGGEVAVRPFLLPKGGLVPLLGIVDGPDTAREAAGHLLERLGAQAADGQAARTMRDAADTPEEPAARGTADLHHRELQILRLVSEGLRNREVGERLLVSEETVKWYLKRLYSKLDVTTRTSAVARGRELGLLT